MKCQVHDIPLILERGGLDMPTVHGRMYCPECSKALMKALDKQDESVYVEVTYEEGSVARWVIPANDPRVDKIEELLGHPDTLRT